MRAVKAVPVCGPCPLCGGYIPAICTTYAAGLQYSHCPHCGHNVVPKAGYRPAWAGRKIANRGYNTANGTWAYTRLQYGCYQHLYALATLWGVPLHVAAMRAVHMAVWQLSSRNVAKVSQLLHG
jgi:hypothetical protein